MYFESKLPLSSGKLICLENLEKFENVLQGYGKFTKMFCKDMENCRKCFARIGKIFENVLQGYGKFSKNQQSSGSLQKSSKAIQKSLKKYFETENLYDIPHFF